MTREEAIERMEMLRQQYEGALLTTQAIDMAIEALTYQNLSKPNNTCEVDLISREDAMGAVQDHFSADGFKGYYDGQKMMDRITALPSAEAEWIPCSERLPDAEKCPMDCIVTRKNEFMGNFVDMAVAEADGTWTHEDWDAIVLGDVESGRKTGLISTHDDEIIAWMPLIQPYREDGEI